MLKLLLGRAGTGKARPGSSGPSPGDQGGGPSCSLSPEQHSHDMERRLCAEGGNSVSLYAEVLSLTRLASRVPSQ